MEQRIKITDTIDTIQSMYENVKISAELITAKTAPFEYSAAIEWRASFKGKSATFKSDFPSTDSEVYDELLVIVLEVISTDKPNLIIV